MNWIVAIGGDETNPPIIRFGEGPDAFSAMRSAYGMESERVSVRRIIGWNSISQKTRDEVVKDFTAKHLLRLKSIRSGSDRLVLKGLQRTQGKPKPEDFEV